MRWFRRAAETADADALNMVGRCRDARWGVAEDFCEAAWYFERDAEQGHSWAQYNAGQLDLDGRGVTRDAHRAFALYLKAARQGHERAMNLLGRCCEEGWGTPVDRQVAAEWYRRSAEGGYFRGQFNWATLRLRAGRIDEAAHWFERAAGGTPAARDAVLRLCARAPLPALRAMAERLNAST